MPAKVYVFTERTFFFSIHLVPENNFKCLAPFFLKKNDHAVKKALNID